MYGWVRWSVGVAGAVVGGAVAATIIGADGWARQSERMVDELYRADARGGPAVFSQGELRGLPAPVVRYFEFALEPGQPLIEGARLVHEGQFRSGLDAAWAPFRSEQRFTVAPAGFVWDASIDMAPMVKVRVRDSYIRGRAGMLVKVAGLIPVVDEHGADHLNSGALHRFLLEAPWVPTALLPSQGVRWDAVDDSTARATLTDSGITVSMDVHFGAGGEIVRVEALRMRDVDGIGVPTPFVGILRDYAPIDGMMIPRGGEVEWILPEGAWQFWKGSVVEADYTYRR